MKLIEKKDFNSLFYLLGVGIFVAFLIFTVSGTEGLFKLWRLKQVKNQIAAENRNLLRENLALSQEQKSLYDLKFVEHIARKSLGFVYPDEIVFVPSP